MVFHPLAWLAWLTGSAYLVLANQQPLHTILAVMALGVVFSWGSRRNSLAQGWRSFLKLGVGVWSIALLFNVLFARGGHLVLVRLPSHWPLIGGAITLEAFLYGLASGGNLFATLLVFATFNLVVDRNRLLRWVPPGLYQSGLIVSIALAFVPQMITSFQSIREAQAIRGHRVRGVRDMIPLLVPLVTTALERSLILAESMESRGFGATRGSPNGGQAPVQVTAAVGLLTMVLGLLARGLQLTDSTTASVLLVVGLAMMLAALFLQGQTVRRTNYRRDVWRARDSWLTISSLVALVLVLSVQRTDPLALVYNPYPPFVPWPTFSAVVGLAALLTATPAVLHQAASSDKVVLPAAKDATTLAGDR